MDKMEILGSMVLMLEQCTDQQSGQVDEARFKAGVDALSEQVVHEQSQQPAEPAPAAPTSNEQHFKEELHPRIGGKFIRKPGKAKGGKGRKPPLNREDMPEASKLHAAASEGATPQDKHGKQQPTEKTKTGPSKPEEREPGVVPPVLPMKAPPAPKAQSKAPKNKEGRPTTGYTASGLTNTAFGDLVEGLMSKLGMRSILPEGKRSHAPGEVAEKGSTIDVEYDHSGYAFEVKAVCVEATEYKAKPKADEIQGKLKFAELNGLKPNIMVVVTDVRAGKAWAYWREGIRAVGINPGNPKSLELWNYAGEIEFAPPGVNY